MPCFSQGACAITVKVNESSKDKFVAKMLFDNSSRIIDGVGGTTAKLVRGVQKKAGITSQSKNNLWNEPFYLSPANAASIYAGGTLTIGYTGYKKVV